MSRTNKQIILSILMLMLISCGGSETSDDMIGGSSSPKHVCANPMKDVTRKYGKPEEIEKYDTDRYHSHDYWYWSKGIKYGFTWATYIDGCEVDRYTFTPIR